MRGIHDGAVGIRNAYGPCRWAFVDDGGGDSAKMRSAARVGNCRDVGRYFGWGGGPMVTVERLV